MKITDKVGYMISDRSRRLELLRIYTAEMRAAQYRFEALIAIRAALRRSKLRLPSGVFDILDTFEATWEHDFSEAQQKTKEIEI